MVDRDVLESAIAAINGLLKFAKKCEHVTTHRGGAIWEICDCCGAKWADDDGGKPEYEEPAEVEAAMIAIRLLEASMVVADRSSWVSAEDIVRERLLADDIVDKAARRAARVIWKDCLGRCGIKEEFQRVGDDVKYREILPMWAGIIKREILGIHG